MKTALITGAYGQDGSYLSKLLLENNYKVYAAAPRSSHDYLIRHRILKIDKDLHHIPLDVTELFQIFEVVNKYKFDEVYNLAAQSFVGISWDNPFATSTVNALGTLNLLDAIKRFSPRTKFYQASTSEMFGLVREPIQSEQTPFYPRSPYGVSKLFAHAMTVNYRESFDLFACSGILFNHESPLRGNEFVTKKISSYFANYIKSKKQSAPLLLGNLDAKRDWGYAPEYVLGMWKMLQHPKPDDYVLATGKTHSVRDFCTAVANAIDIQIEWNGSNLAEVGIDGKTGNVIVQIDKSLYRPAEVDLLIGNAEKAKNTLNWQPIKTMNEIAAEMVYFSLEHP